MNRNPCSWYVLLPALRYVELNFDWNPMRHEYFNNRSVIPIYNRCFILDQLRHCAPSLQCLTLWWHDLHSLLEHSHSPWPSIQELNIRLRAGRVPCASLIKRLPISKVFPQLRYLTVGPRRLMLTSPEWLAEWILSWIDALLVPASKLVSLHVNRRCSYSRTSPSTACDKLMMLLKQHDRLSDYHHPPAKILIDSNEEIIIWL